MNDDDDLPILNVLREKLTAGIAGHAGRNDRHRPSALVLVGAALAVLVIAGVVALAHPQRSGRQVAVNGPLAGFAASPTAGSGGAGGGAAPGAGGTDPASPGGVTGSPPAGAGSTTSVSGSAGHDPSTGVTINPVPPIASTPPGLPSPTTAVTVTVPPPPPGGGTGIVLTVANGGGGPNGGPTVKMARGTTIQVELDASASSIWPHQPTSSDTAVVEPISGSSTPTSSHATFDARAPGTATLSTYGVPPCAQQPPPSGAPVACPALAAVWSVTITVT